MRARSARVRLGEILLQAGLVDAEGLARALERQKAQPGRLGHQLATLGLVSESDLAKALSMHFEVSPFLPSLDEVDPAAVERLPHATARRCGAFPFGWEPDRGTLRVVMADPHDLQAVDEVRFASGARKVAVHVASDATLERLLSRYYNGVEVSPPASLEIAVNLSEPSAPRSSDAGASAARARAEVLVADPDPKRRRAMAALLEASGFRVTRADSADDAEDLSGRRAWAAVWAHEEWRPEGCDPSILSVYADPVAALRDAAGPVGELRREAFDLAELAALHLPAGQLSASKKAVSLVRFLAARAGIAGLDADCLALATWRAAFSGWDTEAGRPQVRGGEIVTAVRVYGRAVVAGRSPAEVAEELRTDSTLDPAAVTSLIRWAMGEDLLSRFETPPRALLVLPPDDAARLAAHLSASGWQVTTSAAGGAADPPEGAWDAVLADLAAGLPYLEQTSGAGADKRPPVFLLAANPGSADTMYALNLGAEDVLASDTHPEVLETKLRRAAARRFPGKGLVSGNLRDMGLADMLQILSNGLKTAVVRVEGAAGTGEVALDRGAIVDARLGDAEGADALYAMIAWGDGSFRIFPGEGARAVTLTGSTEGLLMEGFRRLDEERRSEESNLGLDEIPKL